eukprot:CAMPEP_0198506464 /NCGR_PEP_ID=MMETSP1462-20131121/11710_1 /TAXON_ID=1333877 /ORGANISM="Brandtodinium nutriculum, Strain RCC3387" /LENGTH=46 /DNA_ID= /DNA_START= /DNA_END= /DNA_ORIENTATION=
MSLRLWDSMAVMPHELIATIAGAQKRIISSSAGPAKQTNPWRTANA